MPGGVCVYVCIYQHLGDRAMQILIYIFVMRRASVAGEDGTSMNMCSVFTSLPDTL